MDQSLLHRTDMSPVGSVSKIEFVNGKLVIKKTDGSLTVHDNPAFDCEILHGTSMASLSS